MTSKGYFFIVYLSPDRIIFMLTDGGIPKLSVFEGLDTSHLTHGHITESQHDVSISFLNPSLEDTLNVYGYESNGRLSLNGEYEKHPELSWSHEFSLLESEE